jgi:hypothetical protein
MMHTTRWLCALLLTTTLAGCPSEQTQTPPVERSWKIVADGIDEGALMAATTLPDGRAVIFGGQSDKGAVWTLESDKLNAEPVPLGKLLTWGSVGADGLLLVVGNGRRALWRSETGAWTTEDLPAGDELWGCLAFSKNDAYAVGADKVSGDLFEPVLLHRDASGWSKVALPTISKDRANARLFKIAAQAPDDMLIVGDVGLALHWDGQAWREEPTGVADNLVTTRALDDGGYVVVGGLSTGFVLTRGAAGKWRKLGDVLVGTTGVDVFGDDVWVAGYYGWIERVSLATGKGEALDDPLTSDVLHFVVRLPGGDALAGGGNFTAWPGPMKGVLLRWGP